MLKVFKYFVRLVLNILTLIGSSLIPKKKNLVVVGGWKGRRFADNSKYLFIEYLEKYEGHYELYWITDDITIYNDIRGKYDKVLLKRSLKSLWIHFRAKYHIIDQSYQDILGWTSVCAIRINLWHGLPLKRIWRAQCHSNKSTKIQRFLGDKLYDNLSKMFFIGFWSDFKLLVPSEYVRDNFFAHCISQRQIKNVILAPYPRVSYLRGCFSNPFLTNSEAEYIRRFTSIKDNGGKIIVYMPTFRDSQSYLPMGVSTIQEIEEFNFFLEKNNMHFFLKPHPADLVLLQVAKSHIHLIDAQSDIYPMLPYTDCLVTDYSSISFDYLALKKPVVFYVFDYESYKTSDRGVLYYCEDVFPNSILTYNLLELSESLCKVLSNCVDRDAFDMQSNMFFDKSLVSLNKILSDNI